MIRDYREKLIDELKNDFDKEKCIFSVANDHFGTVYIAQKCGNRIDVVELEYDMQYGIDKCFERAREIHDNEIRKIKKSNKLHEESD